MPSGVTPDGSPALLASSSVAPVPSASCQNRRAPGWPKIRRRPSGVHTGKKYPEGGNVYLVEWRLARSHIQMSESAP